MLPAIVFGAMAPEVFKDPENVAPAVLVAFAASLFAIVPAILGAAIGAFKNWLEGFESDQNK